MMMDNGELQSGSQLAVPPAPPAPPPPPAPLTPWLAPPSPFVPHDRGPSTPVAQGVPVLSLAESFPTVSVSPIISLRVWATSLCACCCAWKV